MGETAQVSGKMETQRCVRTRWDTRVKAVSSRALRLNCPEYRLPVLTYSFGLVALPPVDGLQ